MVMAGVGVRVRVRVRVRGLALPGGEAKNAGAVFDICLQPKRWYPGLNV